MRPSLAPFACALVVAACTKDERTPWPALTSHGAASARPTHLVTVLTPDDPQAEELSRFAEGAGDTTWWASLRAEYGVGELVASATWVGDALPEGALEDDVLLRYVEATRTAEGVEPDPDALYVLYLPEGTTTRDPSTGQANDACERARGFHLETEGLGWAVVERCPPVHRGWTELMALTHTASHEIAEVAARGASLSCATPESPWRCHPLATATQGEVADLCPETRWDEDGFTFTRVYSPSAAAKGGDPCAPATTRPYASVSSPKDWYAARPGERVEIELTGWSTGRTPPWTIYASIARDHLPDDEPRWSTSLSATTLYTGGHAALVVNVAREAAKGEWAIVFIGSAPRHATRGDAAHARYVGVYVP